MIESVKAESAPLYGQAKAVTNRAWLAVFEPMEGGQSHEERPIKEVRLFFQRIHQEIHAIHKAFEKPFEDLAKAVKVVVDPIIKVLELLLKQADKEKSGKSVNIAVIRHVKHVSRLTFVGRSPEQADGEE